MQDRSLGETGRRQFRAGAAVRLGMAFVVVALASGCVAETKHRRVVRELDIATKVHRAMENRMRIAEVELAEARGTQGMGAFGLKVIQAELDAVRVENAALYDQVALLDEQVRNIPALELPRNDSPGFREEDFSDFPGARVVRGELILEGDVTFAAGKTTLRPDAKRVLDRVAEVKNGRHNGQKVFISGHTDNTPLNKSKRLYADNWDLALKRAHAVFKYLESRGVPDTDMILQAYGYADPAPGVDPNSSAGRARCRRVEIHLGSN